MTIVTAVTAVHSRFVAEFVGAINVLISLDQPAGSNLKLREKN